MPSEGGAGPDSRPPESEPLADWKPISAPVATPEDGVLGQGSTDGRSHHASKKDEDGGQSTPAAN